jgi:competence protein ComEA
VPDLALNNPDRPIRSNRTESGRSVLEAKERVMTRWFVAAALAALMITTTIVSAALPEPQQNSAQATQVVNLNTAAAADLQKLPGIGAAMAARIIEYRQKNGGFKKVEELMNVQGIGEKVFLRLKPLVSVTPPKATER